MPKITPITGHQAALDSLHRDIDTSNISHAYLFAGQGMLGKRTTAFWLANKILNAADDTDIQHRIEKLIHPDLLVLDVLWIDKKTDDWDYLAKHSNAPQVHRSKTPPAKTDVIGINDIRALQDRLHETGISGKRVCIITKMERMNDAAANAFLKILEEPPKGLTFILTTENSAALLPTIISRVRNVEFQQLSHGEIQSLLTDASVTEQGFITNLAQGAPGLAKNLQADPDLLREYRTSYDTMKRFWHTDSLKERLTTIKPLLDRGEEANKVLNHLGLSLRHLPADEVCKYTPMYNKLVQSLRTNAYRPLIVQKFALSIA